VHKSVCVCVCVVVVVVVGNKRLINLRGLAKWTNKP